MVRDLSYLLMRVSLGSLVLYHAFTCGKLTGKVTIAYLAATLAKRGLEPSVPFAYLVFFSETVAAVCLIVGLFTRFVRRRDRDRARRDHLRGLLAKRLPLRADAGRRRRAAAAVGLHGVHRRAARRRTYSLDRKIGWEL